jgi:uncharacterized membrane protein YozB (DUF420 family)
MLGGFLPTARESTFMFDVIVLAMTVVLPLLTWSIYLVKYRRAYALHKRIQTGLGVALLLAVILFEADIRLQPSWWDRALSSPYHARGILRPWLWLHLSIAVTTTVLWIVTLIGALRNFAAPPTPGSYSRQHLRYARLAGIGMYVTAITGWIFYWMAFVAT